MNILHNWEDDLGWDRVLTVPTPQVLTYYSDIDFADNGSTSAACPIAITEYVVIAALRFLSAACHSAIDSACLDSCRGGNGCGGFVPFLSVDHRNVDDISFPKIINGSRFDPFAFLATYWRSRETDWALKSWPNVGIAIHSLQG